MTWTEVAANAALCVLAVEMVVFTATYVGESPWWSTRLGQIYAVKSILLTLVLLQNAASVLSDSDYTGRHYFRLAIYGGGVLAMIALWLILRRYQREGKATRAAAGDRRSQPQLWADTLREWARRRS